MTDPTPSYYNKVYKGIKLDPYRIAEIYGITDHAMFQALKKLLAAGQRGDKDFRQDLLEARNAIERKIEMIGEDAAPLNTIGSTEHDIRLRTYAPKPPWEVTR